MDRRSQLAGLVLVLGVAARQVAWARRRAECHNGHRRDKRGCDPPASARRCHPLERAGTNHRVARLTCPARRSRPCNRRCDTLRPPDPRFGRSSRATHRRRPAGGAGGAMRCAGRRRAADRRARAGPSWQLDGPVRVSSTTPVEWECWTTGKRCALAIARTPRSAMASTASCWAELDLRLTVGISSGPGCGGQSIPRPSRGTEPKRRDGRHTGRPSRETFRCCPRLAADPVLVRNRRQLVAGQRADDGRRNVAVVVIDVDVALNDRAPRAGGRDRHVDHARLAGTQRERRE